MKETIFFLLLEVKGTKSTKMKHFFSEKLLSEFYDWIEEKVKAEPGCVVLDLKIFKQGY